MKRALVAGLGVMGGHHLRVLRSLDGVEVVAAVDPSPERRAAAERVHPGLRTFATLDEALRRQPDFACLAAPVAELPGLATRVLDAGLALLVEKPMAPLEEQAAELVADAQRRGLLLAVGHVERCNPAVTALRRRLDEGAIGEVIQLHARRLSPFPDRDSMLGVALDLATHDIDVMRYLTGAEVSRVFGETRSVAEHWSGLSHSRSGSVRAGAERSRPDRAEDLLCATLRFDSGATGLLEVNWLTPTKVRELSVTGEKGMLVVDYLTQDLTFYEHPSVRTEWDALAGMRGPGEGDMVRYALARKEPLRVEWEAFLAALRDGTPPLVTGADGLAALSTARAIQRSGACGEAVVPGYRRVAA